LRGWYDIRPTHPGKFSKKLVNKNAIIPKLVNISGEFYLVCLETPHPTPAKI
jgi:hypothetical protein